MKQRFALITLLATMIVGGAPAAPMPQQQEQPGDADRARLLGALVNTRITAKFDDMSARDVVAAIGKAAEVSIIARWGEPGDSFDFDPQRTISLTVENRPALDVLEVVLDQCAEYEDLTWQLRRGFVELGTKPRLSVPAARESRTYHIRDLMLEPPRFAASGDEQTPALGPYGAAYIGTPAPTTIGSSVGPFGGKARTRRKMPEALGIEIVEAVVETIEPGQWDYGQEQAAPKPDPATASAPSAPAAPSSDDQMTRSAPPQKLKDRSKYWASIRMWRDQLIVNAPDFMHRRINGYPLPPDGPVRHVMIAPPVDAVEKPVAPPEKPTAHPKQE